MRMCARPLLFERADRFENDWRVRGRLGLRGAVARLQLHEFEGLAEQPVEGVLLPPRENSTDLPNGLVLERGRLAVQRVGYRGDPIAAGNPSGITPIFGPGRRQL